MTRRPGGWRRDHHCPAGHHRAARRPGPGARLRRDGRGPDHGGGPGPAARVPGRRAGQRRARPRAGRPPGQRVLRRRDASRRSGRLGHRRGAAARDGVHGLPPDVHHGSGEATGHGAGLRCGEFAGAEVARRAGARRASGRAVHLAEAAGRAQPGLDRAAVPGALDELLAAGAGLVRLVTLAPEVDGGLAAVGQLASAGVVVSVGHSNATGAQVAAAAGAGARMVTHLFNAQPAIKSREPGVAGQALADPRLTSGLIMDTHHVATANCTLAFAAAPGRDLPGHRRGGVRGHAAGGVPARGRADHAAARRRRAAAPRGRRAGRVGAADRPGRREHGGGAGPGGHPTGPGWPRRWPPRPGSPPT